MKKCLTVLFVLLIAAVTVGCEAQRISNVEGGVIVKIERPVRLSSDPYLAFSAETAILNYDQRRVEISGISSVTGDLDWSEPINWVVPKIEVKDSKIIIPIPDDVDYVVYIGKQKHVLPEVVKKKEEKK